MELKSFQGARGVMLQPHSSWRVILTLAYGLYLEVDDKTAAVEMANAIIAASHRTRQVISSEGFNTPQQHHHFNIEGISEEQIAHNVAMRLQNAGKKFSGDLGECGMKFVD